MARAVLHRLLFGLVLVLLALSACGDTWRGVKKDTRENIGTVGRTVEKLGEKMRKAAD